MEKFKALKLKWARVDNRPRSLSQERIAKEAGLSVAGYGQIERGTRKPKADTLYAIAKVLKKPMEYFFE